MRAFIFILHTPDTFCITFVQIASFFIQTFLLILCEKRSSCGLDDVGCGWLGPSQERGGKKKLLHQVTQNLQELKILFHGTMLEGRKRRKTFMQLTMHATIYACTLQKKRGTPSCCSPLGFWVFCVHFHPAMCIFLYLRYDYLSFLLHCSASRAFSAMKRPMFALEEQEFTSGSS